MGSKITVKGLLKKLDTITRELVFERDEYCVTCPIWMEIKPEHTPSQVMQPGHYITRGARSVRWDLRNVYKQCRTCNMMHEYRPEVMAWYVLSVLGIKGFEKLVFDGNKPKKFLKPDLEELYEKLKSMKKKEMIIGRGGR